MLTVVSIWVICVFFWFKYNSHRTRRRFVWNLKLAYISWVGSVLGVVELPCSRKNTTRRVFFSSLCPLQKTHWIIIWRGNFHRMTATRWEMCRWDMLNSAIRIIRVWIAFQNWPHRRISPRQELFFMKFELSQETLKKNTKMLSNFMFAKKNLYCTSQSFESEKRFGEIYRENMIHGRLQGRRQQKRWN